YGRRRFRPSYHRFFRCCCRRASVERFGRYNIDCRLASRSIAAHLIAAKRTETIEERRGNNEPEEIGGPWTRTAPFGDDALLRLSHGRIGAIEAGDRARRIFS